MGQHVQKIEMYSLPSDQPFAGPLTQTVSDPLEGVHEGNLRALIAQMPAVLWTTDLELTVNFSAGNGLARFHTEGSATSAMWGHAGMPLREFFGMESDPTPMITAHLKALGGYAQSFEFGREGAFFTATVEPLFNPDGGLMGTVGTLMEITERQHAEQERLRQQAARHEADKRQGLTNLAEHMSQHFNELFNAMSDHAATARMGLESEHPMQWCLGEIEKAAQCAVDLIDQLANVPEQEPAQRESVDLTQLIQNQLQTFQAFLSGGISLQCDLAQDSSAIEGDAEQLRRLLVNLLFNAAAAIGADKGTICLRTQVTSGPPSVLLDQEDGTRLPEGQYVWLQVSDTGRGLDREAKIRVFEPFAGFTAPGIGLATAKAIVSAHRGAITISSKPGLGTTCHVLLPAIHVDEMLPPENFF